MRDRGIGTEDRREDWAKRRLERRLERRSEWRSEWRPEWRPIHGAREVGWTITWVRVIHVVHYSEKNICYDVDTPSGPPPSKASAWTGATQYSTGSDTFCR